jgi:hypothetical protein
MRTLSTQVPEHLRKRVEAEASRHGMSTAEWLRFQLRKLTDTEPRALDELDAPADTEAVAA